MRRARAIAFYLPQFHPIPENDLWWGKGFTEWTNTARARPMFRGHYQPHIPADLGFYDLRLPETREAQAAMARHYGIEGFCYYHYWFGGQRILERPFNEVLASGSPDFPFCLCWANETWTGIWHGAPNRVLIEQTYPGPADDEAHFAALLHAFCDPRYIRVEGKPLFLIYKPDKLPAASLALWRKLAAAAGLPGLHMVGVSSDLSWKPWQHGYDGKVVTPIVLPRQWVSRRRPLKWLRYRYPIWRGRPTVHSYAAFVEGHVRVQDPDGRLYPCLIHAWDNTPRSGVGGMVLQGSTPELFRRLLGDAVSALRDVPAERQLVFLKSWNEWAEGNHLEPDRRSGHGYLNVVREVLADPDEPAGVIAAPQGRATEPSAVSSLIAG